MKILVGIDGSPHSKAALDYVKSMAWPKGTNVAVVSAAVPMLVTFARSCLLRSP